MTSDNSFVQTRWSLLERLSDPSPEQARRAMEELARVYRPCICAQFQKLVGQRELAEDLTQGFFVDVVIGRGLFEGVEKKEGTPLRRLIFTAIGNYARDAQRRRVARSPREGARAVSLEGAASEVAVVGPEGELEFSRGWGAAVMAESLRRLRAYFEQRGRAGHWALFEEWTVRPQVGHTRPAPMSELGPRHGFASGVAGSAAVQEVRRRWEIVVREVLAETAPAALVEEEFGMLRSALGG
jgi:DNA-directed RNA polymerase specialized sigma24 family protein